MFMIPKLSKAVATAGRRFAAPAAFARCFSQITYGPSQAFVTKPAPTFKAPAVVDNDITTVNLEDYKGKYVVLFFYPKDFTFVCPTEIIAFSDRAEEFRKINTELIACSCDTVESHLAWIKTPRKKGGLGNMKIPIIGDNTKEIASKYGVLHNELGIALRGLFIINPQGVIENITMNNFPVGRSVDETLRLVQAFQFVAEHGEVCPANWKPGEKTIDTKGDNSLEYFGSGATESKEDEHLMGADVVQVRDEKHFKELLSGSKQLVVDFYAPWCGKCKMIAPFYNKMAAENKNVVFASVDTTDEKLEKFAADYGVKHIPSFHFYKDGKEAAAEITGYKKQLIAKQVKDLFN